MISEPGTRESPLMAHDARIIGLERAYDVDTDEPNVVLYLHFVKSGQFYTIALSVADACKIGQFVEEIEDGA